MKGVHSVCQKQEINYLIRQTEQVAVVDLIEGGDEGWGWGWINAATYVGNPRYMSSVSPHRVSMGASDCLNRVC